MIIAFIEHFLQYYLQYFVIISAEAFSQRSSLSNSQQLSLWQFTAKPIIEQNDDDLSTRHVLSFYVW